MPPVTLLRDAPALGWLRARGIGVDSGPHFDLVGQEALLPGARVRRLWHTPATLQHPATSEHAPGALVALVPLEGAFTIASGGDAAIVGRGRVAVLPGGAPVAITTGAPASRLELLVRPAGLDSALPSRLLVCSSAAVPVLSATLNALLEAKIEPGDPARVGLSAALGGLLRAVLGEAVRG